MSEVELRELDAWIAEKFMGWSHIPDSNPLAWVDYTGKITTWETTGYGDAFQPTRLPAAFALVKREIERRGWDWECKAVQVEDTWKPVGEQNRRVYWFTIFGAGNDTISSEEYQAQLILHERIGWASGNTEELAGCLAVKAAVESMA